MSTTEDIEIAKQANAALIAREDAAAGTNVLSLMGGPSDNYGVPDTNLDFTDQAPMVIEGQLPNFVEPSVAEAAWTTNPAATPYADSLGGGATPTPYADGGFGVDAFDPNEIFASINNPTYRYDPRYDSPEDAPDPNLKTGQRPEEPWGVGGTPYADGDLDPDPVRDEKADKEQKKKAATGLAVMKLTKKVFDEMSSEEQEAEVNQIIGAKDALEGVGEATGVDTTEGLVPAAIGAGERAGVPAAQSMAAKGPLTPVQELDRIEVEKRQLAVKSIDQQIVASERLAARQKVAKAESDVERETKIKESDASFDELKSAMDSVGDFKADRDRYWGSKSTGLKIATAISLMLSAYAHAKSGRGGVDPALQMMMRAVDKDVADQVMEYNSKVAGVGRKKTLYSMYRQKLGDHDRAVAATELSMLRGVQTDMMRQEMKTKSQMAKLQLQEARQKIRLREQGLLSNFRPKNFREQLASDKFEYTKKQDRTERTTNIKVNGKFLMAATPKQAQAANKVHVARNIFKDQLIDMKGTIKEFDMGDLLAPWTTSTANKIQNMRAEMIGSFKGMVSPGGGVLSDEDRKQINKVNKDITKLLSLDNILGAAGVMKLAQESMDQFIIYADRRAEQEIQSLTIGYQTPKQRSGIQRGDFRTNRR